MNNQNSLYPVQPLDDDYPTDAGRMYDEEMAAEESEADEKTEFQR
jgi:hypothetical protein